MNGEPAIEPLVLSDLFRVGELIQFHETGSRAWILDVNIEDGDNEDELSCRVKHVIDNREEDGVDIRSFRVISNAEGETDTRSGNVTRNHHVPPSLAASTSNGTTQQDSPALRAVKQEWKDLKDTIKRAFHEAHRSTHTVNPPTDAINLYQLLKNNYTARPKGWIRKIIMVDDSVTEVNVKKHLTERQDKVLLTIITFFSSMPACSGKVKGWRKFVDHAFGVAQKKSIRLFEKYYDSDFEIGRKVRSDKNSSVFTCEKKRQNTFTGYMIYKKRRHAQYRDTYTRIPDETLHEEYDNLSPNQKHAHEILAQRDLHRSRYIWDELVEFLLKTKGKVPYQTMTTYLDNIVSTQTIMNFLKQQDGWHMRKDRILPALQSGARLQRLTWSETWWLFWLSVACIPVTKVRVVLVHFDEKWFHACVTRCNCKILTSIGLDPADYYTRHKSYMDKEMYAVCTAYVLNENNIEKGGIAIPIACVRIGMMKTAKWDTYRRVYKEDGSHHHPHIPENLLRRKGQSYFKPLELTGSSTEAKGKPKISLLKIYQDEIIPELERKVVERFSDNGNVKVIIVKQEDSAGAHTCKKYIREMNREFERRDWIHFNQPPQSPITNVHDACIFPMMSKCVSKEQASTFGSRLLQGEQLYQTVMKVWNNSKNTQAIARAFAGHHQIVETIRQNKGDNKFLTEKQGLTFGVRRTFIRNAEGDGVVLVNRAPENETETAQGAVLNENARRGLKHTAPNPLELQLANLTSNMKDMLLEHMDPALMSEELHEVWFNITEDT